ncbi:MAG: ABC transporter ATP-binding protein [Acidimicrobiia bacterium]
MSGVGLRAVTKRWGSVTAVDALDLDARPGEFLVLLGPSGCGKSTVLRMIAGLEDPTEGEITIGDRVVNDIEPKDRDVAMVFQSYALYPHKTVRANIEFPLRARGIERYDRDALVMEAATVLGLGELLDRKPAALSGGQRQRVALARAMVRKASVFLMDEPLSNLDAKLRAQTRVEITSLHQKIGATFVYVTHDQVEAMTMGQRIAIMNAGKLEQVGPPQAVYERPASVFVAQFIGTPPMNILGPSVVEAGTHLVGVRPEHVRFSEVGIAATVTLVESLGHECLYTCTTSGGTNVIVRQATGLAGPTLGREVHLHIPESNRHRFDPHSGRRMEGDA